MRFSAGLPGSSSSAARAAAPRRRRSRALGASSPERASRGSPERRGQTPSPQHHPPSRRPRPCRSSSRRARHARLGGLDSTAQADAHRPADRECAHASGGDRGRRRRRRRGRARLWSVGLRGRESRGLDGGGAANRANERLRPSTRPPRRPADDRAGARDRSAGGGETRPTRPHTDLLAIAGAHEKTMRGDDGSGPTSKPARAEATALAELAAALAGAASARRALRACAGGASVPPSKPSARPSSCSTTTA